MALVVPDIAKRDHLEWWLQGLEALDEDLPITLHLFQNDVTPDHATLLVDLAEADFAGYEPKVINVGELMPGLDPMRRAVVTWPLQTWVKEAGDDGNVYGLYITAGDDMLLWAERAPQVPIEMNLVGRELIVLPKFTDRSEFNN